MSLYHYIQWRFFSFYKLRFCIGYILRTLPYFCHYPIKLILKIYQSVMFKVVQLFPAPSLFLSSLWIQFCPPINRVVNNICFRDSVCCMIFKKSPLRYHKTCYLFQSKNAFCFWVVFLYNWSRTCQLLFMGLFDSVIFRSLVWVIWN